MDRGERWDFLRGIAVPVFGPDAGVKAAVVCIGRFELTDETERNYSQEMKLQAESLSERLSRS